MNICRCISTCTTARTRTRCLTVPGRKRVLWRSKFLHSRAMPPHQQQSPIPADHQLTCTFKGHICMGSLGTTAGIHSCSATGPLACPRPVLYEDFSSAGNMGNQLYKFHLEQRVRVWVGFFPPLERRNGAVTCPSC